MSVVLNRSAIERKWFQQDQNHDRVWLKRLRNFQRRISHFSEIYWPSGYNFIQFEASNSLTAFDFITDLKNMALDLS